MTDAQIGGGEGGRRVGLSCPFLKIEKSPRFGEKVLDCAHLCVKFSIQNRVLRVSRRKHSKIFLCRTFFSCIFDEMFILVPKFHEISPVLKNVWLNKMDLSQKRSFVDNYFIFLIILLHYKNLLC